MGAILEGKPEHRNIPSENPTAACSPYRVGLWRAVQLYHVALQVLLLHELLGAGGALEDRRGGSASSQPPNSNFGTQTGPAVYRAGEHCSNVEHKSHVRP